MRSDREFAPAKVNLALHVTGRRDDGYHLLDSLVVFPRIGDTLEAEPSATLTLAISGPFAEPLGAGRDNLVLRAARLVGGAGASLRLTKRLPVASGIGGGSADAAATLRLLARLHGVSLPPEDAILGLGADVPVCLASRAARMSGIGERIEPLALPAFWLVLVNPGVAVPTATVFRTLARRENPPLPEMPSHPDLDTLVSYLSATRNHLEAPARALQPAIADALAALLTQSGCRLARMSGSGATCCGIFGTQARAEAAALEIEQMEPGWWVAAAEVA
jgi:4-diphosphocytidyl-2-C-methyl-D-erythritol kinase